MPSQMIDTTLPPSSSPAMDRFRDVGREILPFALYVHVELDRRDLMDLLRVCSSEHEEGCVRLAPNYRLYNQPLRAAYNLHVNQVSAEGTFDPIYFAAVIDKDWKTAGVLLVSLDTAEDEARCTVDQMRVRTKNAGLYLANLQIANMDWADYKNGEDDGEGGDHNDDDGDEAVQDDEDEMDANRSEDKMREVNGNEPGMLKETTSAQTATDDQVAESLDPYGHMTDEEYNDGASLTASSIGYWIGLYAIREVVFEDLMRQLDNCPIQRPLNELETRPLGRVGGDQEKSVGEACRLHPMRCRNNPLLCRNMFLIADTDNYHENGLLLVRMVWDEQIDGQSLDHLATKGSIATYDMRRVQTASHSTTTLFNMIVRGYTPWKPTQPTFLFYDESNNYSSRSIRFLDRSASKRVEGMEKFLEASLNYKVLTREEQDKFRNRWEQVLLRHPLQVYRQRFCVTLKRRYFVYSETEIKSSTALVTLAKMDWDGNAEGLTADELSGIVDVRGVFGVTTMQCPAGEAYNTLVELIEERKRWTS